MQQYKNYWIGGGALPTFGYGNKWYARGSVYTIEPNGYTVEKERFEPREIFTSKKQAEAYGVWNWLRNGWMNNQQK